jgi:probable F420-dependent oxidoreductase
MRFGIHANSFANGPELIRFARRAEELGYDTFTIADHIREGQLSPVVAMTVAAMATSRLRVGAMVFGNDYRHPAILAREMATLDVLSGGRTQVGLGAGWLESDYRSAGIQFDPPGARVSRLAEAIAVMKGLWQESSFSFKGESYHLDLCDGSPQPIQRPHPPIMIGAGGRRMIGLAAREADIVNLSVNQRVGRYDDNSIFADPENSGVRRFDERVEWLRSDAAERFDQIEISVFGQVQLTDDRESALGASAAALGVSKEWVAANPMMLIGTVDQIRDDISYKVERYGITYWIFEGAHIEALSPIVAHFTRTAGPTRSEAS